MISKREANLLHSVTDVSLAFYLWIGVLLCVIFWGAYAYIHQFRTGLIVTGMRDQYSWGLYITNFVFFIGISHAGTLISAVLRVTDATWRRPITRLAEGITVFALCIGGPMVIIDMGRPDRMLYLFRYGRIQSPIFWDVLGVSTYLTGCIIYLYLPMIPDLAFLAQQEQFGVWRRKLYRTLSLGWTGSVGEQHILEKCIAILAVFIIPLAVSVHTVVSWIFAMTLRPGWNSSIYGPYFVIGAIYSGGAGVMLSMYILRKVFHLEDYLEPIHFRNLGLLLLAFCLIYIYFNINEYFTTGYKVQGPEKVLVHGLFSGDYSKLFWTVQSMLIIIPVVMMVPVLAFKRLQRFAPGTLALASLGIIVGFWAERFLIIIPTLADPYLPNPKLPYDWLHYHPTWVEWSITAGATAMFLLIYSLFCRVFPMVSIWETREDDTAREAKQAAAPPPPPARRRWWRSTPIVLIACLLFGAGHARAAQKHQAKGPEATTLSLEWQKVPPPTPPMDEVAKQAQSRFRNASAVSRFFGQLFAWIPAEPPDQPQKPPLIVITATLLGAKGEPLAYQVVGLTLKTSFGKLDYGSRPTNAEGKAQFSMQERRYGIYPVEVTYDGGDQFAAAHAVTSVDFGPRPEISLPPEGVLITPYATPAIALPFVCFYGTMWVVFCYVGYLMVWRMRKVRGQQPTQL
jgi:Ni/Fe-hydrogenase subunit HybB-like protein